MQGYRTTKLRCLRPVLKTWIKVVTDMANFWNHHKYKDVPWLSTERSFVSLFAGAVWKEDGACFEEFSDRKKRVGNRDRWYPGRVDMYFTLSRYEFTAEAKSTLSGIIRNDGQAPKRLDAKLTLACKDLTKSRLYPENRRLGILFVVPHIRKKYAHLTKEKLLDWIGMVKSIETGACAWVFPESTLDFSHKGSIYPGMAILIKEVNR
jgi:hypothetical protein